MTFHQQCTKCLKWQAEPKCRINLKAIFFTAYIYSGSGRKQHTHFFPCLNMIGMVLYWCQIVVLGVFVSKHVPSTCCKFDLPLHVRLITWQPAGEAVCSSSPSDWLLTEVRFVRWWFREAPSPRRVCLCTHVWRSAGDFTVEECETEGERLLTDGGIVPLTQFMSGVLCCEETRDTGLGGGTLVL